MNKALIIAKKEFKSYFNGSVAYIIAGLFLFMMGWMFYQILKFYADRSLMMMMSGKNTMNLNDYVFAPHFSNINIVLLIMVPALTMRLFAEEKKNRTMDLLMTSPLTATEIVVGKILAGCFVVWAILSFMILYPITASFFAKFDVGPLYTSFLGMALLSGVYVSIGVFASALTESTIIAYFLAFVITLFFWVIGWAASNMDGASSQSIFNYLSITTHFSDFTKGMIDTSSVIYYLSLIFFFGFLTQRAVESARWR